MIVEETFLDSIYRVISISQGAIRLFFDITFNDFTAKKEKNSQYLNPQINKSEINYQAERILDDYGDNILRLAYSYMHNISDAEDILQDTIIQYIKNNKKFKNRVHEKAWLIRVAINISKNKIKYNKRRQTLEIDENLFKENKDDDDIKFVWDAVKDLPEKYKEVIHLFYYEGYTTEQIAKLLSKNKSTIRSLLRRGRMKLKRILREEYDFDE